AARGRVGGRCRVRGGGDDNDGREHRGGNHSSHPVGARYRRPLMDFDLPGDDDPRRAEVRAWLAEHPRPSGRQLAEAGYVAPPWPAPYGLDADASTQLVIDDELQRAKVSRPMNTIGIGWAGPTVIHAGAEAQQL